ncbi:MAG: hypothetical protein HC771_24650 [Synechococcales cyanobacterium CRU_2_2]|nr:hypothetical protein [Synechococcales cyanobacterium CRU_2_2]
MPESPPSPGDIVLINGSAHRYKHGSSELPKDFHWTLHNAEKVHLSLLPLQYSHQLMDQSEVLDISPDGQRVRVRCLADQAIISVFDLDAVVVLRRKPQ